MTDQPDTHSIVLFDSVCNLCNASARFIARRDPRGRFRFASLQSQAGRRLLDGVAGAEALRRPGRVSGAGPGLRSTSAPATPREVLSFVLIEHGRVFMRSTAALRIMRGLRWPWPMLYALIVIPRPLRDWAYDFIARRRYRWFGRREACERPTSELAARFLEEKKE